MADNILAPLAAITLPDSASVTQRAQSALDFVREFVIDSQSTYEIAAEELIQVKAKANALEKQRTAITGPINAALKAVNDLFRGPAAFLGEAESALKGKMLGYQQEQQRIAAEAQRRAEEAAAVERRRLEAEAAERQRQADQQAAELRRQAETAAAQGNAAAAEHAQHQIEAVQQSAALEVAAIHQTAQVIVAPVVTQAPAKAAGISTSKTVDFELVDLLAVVRHVAQHPELVNLLRLDEVKTRALVRGLGMNTSIPGLRVFEKATLAARTKVAA